MLLPPGSGRALIAVIASLVLFAHTAQAQDERRWALVIGNNDYQHFTKLTTPANDARAVAGVLEELGFTVLSHENLDRAGLNDAVDAFADRILGGVALVYYAGHGVRIGSTNYLVPVDNRARNERDVRNDALPLDRVLGQLAGAGARLVVVFVDACRDNPLPPALLTRSGPALPGLAPTEPPRGTMVVFSAGTNQRALDRLPGDDPGSNGLFARELLPELRRPGVPLDQAVRNARNRVREESRAVGHPQNPAIYDETEGEFFLVPPAPGAAPSPTQTPPVSGGRHGAPAQRVDPVPPKLDPIERDGRVVVATRARRDPRSDSADAGSLPKDAAVYVVGATTGRDKGWYSVERDGRPLGYVFARNVALDADRPIKPEEATPEPSVAAPVTDCDRFAANPSDDRRVVLGIEFRVIDAERAIPACKEAVEQWPHELRLAFQYGRALHKGGDTAGATFWYRKAAEQGHAGAQANLGKMYEVGLGVAVDEEEALRWYRKAAEQGHAGAQDSLGEMYRQGLGVARDEVRRVRRYGKTAEQGRA